MTGPREDFPAPLGRADSGHCTAQECGEHSDIGAPAPVSHAAIPVWLVGNQVWRGLWLGWRFLRQVSGDDAYERYLQHVARFHPDQTPMNRAEHFRSRQEQKWNRVSRCC